MKTKKPLSPIKGSTQDFTEIETAKDDILLLKDHSACVILASGTSNFGLLSEDDKLAMISSYAALLNSLSFPIQIVILSKKMDITSYFNHLDKKIEGQQDDVLREKLRDYREFIQSVVRKNTILEKKFYFVIPFSPLEMGIAGATKKSFTHEYVIARAKTSLYPKRDHLLRLLKRAGLGGRTLYEKEIAELFYAAYNPSRDEGKSSGAIGDYDAVIVAAQKQPS